MSTKTIAVHLPDGAIREVPAGTTPLDIANSISPRLAAASVVARLTPVGRERRQSSAASDGQTTGAW
jgi:threonyl-tRNA synthetase